MKIYQNSDFLKIYNLLSQHTKCAYFVGGFVRDEIFFRQNTFHFPNVFNNKKKITLNQLPTNLVKGTTVFLDKNNLNKFAKLNLTQNLAKKTHYFYEISISQNINFKIEKKYDFNQILKAKYNSQHNHTSNISQNISQNYLIYEDFQNKDIDIEVYDIDENKFVNLMEKLGAKGVGRSFFVYKFGNFDISLPRTESKISSGHKGFSVALTNDEQTASKRRDFTINSIMRNIFTGEILDFYGGISDLSARILRVVNAEKFGEDSLRVLRGVGFVARFGLRVDYETLKIMRKIDLSDLSTDRISGELIKLFGARYQDMGLRLIFQLEIFEFLFGVKIEKKDKNRLIKKLKNGIKFIKDDAYFLYLIANLTSIDKESLLKHLGLSAKYKKIISEPFFSTPSVKNLCEVSLKMPLKNWLGLDNQKLISFAKKTGLFDNKFYLKIDAKELISRGFHGDQIKKELQKIAQNEIDNFAKIANLKSIFL